MVEERGTLNGLWDEEGYGHLEGRKSQNPDQASRLKKLQERDVDNKHKNILYGEQNGLVEIQIIFDQESQNTNLTALCSDLHEVAVRFPVEPNLRCFDTVFRKPYRCFSIVLKVILSLSDRYKLFTNDWPWTEVCQNVVFSKIDITLTTIHKKLWNR